MVSVRVPGERGVIPVFAGHLAGLDEVPFLVDCKRIKGGICQVDRNSIRSCALLALRDALKDAKQLCDDLNIGLYNIRVTIAYIDVPYSTLIPPRALGVEMDQITCLKQPTDEDIGRMHALFGFRLAAAKRADLPPLFNVRKIAWRSDHDLEHAYSQATLLREWQLGDRHHMDQHHWNALSLREPSFEERFYDSLELDPEDEWTPRTRRQSIENLCGMPMRAVNMFNYECRVYFQQ
jgi:hypothetical protein